ncbi:hypothetical protein Tco_0738356 [Tanacetum coccineum]
MTCLQAVEKDPRAELRSPALEKNEKKAITFQTFSTDWWVFIGKVGSPFNLSGITNILHCFSLLSGLSINLKKSNLLGVGVRSEYVKDASVNLGCLTMKTPFKYLGVMVGGICATSQAWEDTIGKLKARLSNWKPQKPSRGCSFKVGLGDLFLGTIPVVSFDLSMAWFQVSFLPHFRACGCETVFCSSSTSSSVEVGLTSSHLSSLQVVHRRYDFVFDWRIGGWRVPACRLLCQRRAKFLRDDGFFLQKPLSLKWIKIWSRTSLGLSAAGFGGFKHGRSTDSFSIGLHWFQMLRLSSLKLKICLKEFST